MTSQEDEIGQAMEFGICRMDGYLPCGRRGCWRRCGPGPVGDGGRVGVEEQVLELPGVAVEADGTAAVAERAARARGWWRGRVRVCVCAGCVGRPSRRG